MSEDRFWWRRAYHFPPVGRGDVVTGTVERRAGLVPLLVIATAQLMLVLDDSIVNIALPSIQRELGVDAVHLPWIVNAYILAFGALLLLGGRVGDLYGRRRALRAGIMLFVLASLAGGFGPTAEALITARALQGIGAALVAPNALALIATTFAERRTRDAALSLYGAMSGLGIVVGVGHRPVQRHRPVRGDHRRHVGVLRRLAPDLPPPRPADAAVRRRHRPVEAAI